MKPKMKPMAATFGWLFGPGGPPKGDHEPPRGILRIWPYSGRVLGVPLGGGHANGSQDPARDCQTKADDEVGLSFAQNYANLLFANAHAVAARTTFLAGLKCRARANHDVGLEH